MTCVRLRSILTFLFVLLPVLAQAEMTMGVAQLGEFIRSSVKLKQPDKQVAVYLKQIKLTERLDDRSVEELQGMGAGPKTVIALRELRDASFNLPAAVPAPAKQVLAVIAPPSSEEQGRIINEARDMALSYTKRLPDFLCTQVTRRYYDPAGMEIWHLMDTVSAKLTYFEQHEQYKVYLVNNKPVDLDPAQLGGSTSSGEFGTLLHDVFDSKSQALFEWERWAKLRGRPAYVFSYRVAQSNSRYNITYRGSSLGAPINTVPGYHGLLFVDKETNQVVRVTFDADSIPPTFPIQQATTQLDYDFTKINEQDYLLPLKAVVRMRQGKLITKNDVEFRMYRKFGADVKLTFDDTTPEPLDESKTKEAPPK